MFDGFDDNFSGMDGGFQDLGGFDGSSDGSGFDSGGLDDSFGLGSDGSADGFGFGSDSSNDTFGTGSESLGGEFDNDLASGFGLSSNNSAEGLASDSGSISERLASDSGSIAEGLGLDNAYAFDSNGDGVADTICGVSDLDGDGQFDVVGRFHDDNQDGLIDRAAAWVDNNGDGQYDLVEKASINEHSGEIRCKVVADQDFDGKADFELSASLNGEPVVDYESIPWGDVTVDNEEFSISTNFLDLDGDGLAETCSYSTPWGENEAEVIASYDSEAIEVPSLEFDSESYLVEGWGSEGLSNFSPDEAVDGSVCGDPAESMQHWEFQGDTNRCALYSQKFVIEELTGKSVPIDEVVDLATERGWFHDGTAALDVDKVLHHYGIDTEVTYHNSLQDIVSHLSNGKERLMAAVDGDENWYGGQADIFSPSSSANHMVEIIGADLRDPSNPMIILNDSGTPDGRGLMVPWERFSDAFEDGDSMLVVCRAGEEAFA
ncbi:MAG: hypothetical protein K6A35_10490 [bacterium]|nr:hypothetical protein [bacterium]